MITIPRKNHSSAKINCLNLADGSSWRILAGDCGVKDFAETLAKTMKLKSCGQSGEKHKSLTIHLPDPNSPSHIFSDTVYDSISHSKEVSCRLNPVKNNDILALQLMELALVFCCKSELNGGLLLHGALIEHNGEGIILAGPGDAGKTTASRRIPQPWLPLSDDCVLIVLDKNNVFRAHPWPTWSTFMFGGTGGSWDVQHSVPLKAVFILEQNEKDQVLALEQGKAVCMLTEIANQPWYLLRDNLNDKNKKAINLQRFSNVCKLVKAIPAYLLKMTKYGLFWEEIDRVLS